MELTEVVQSSKDQSELLDPVHVELLILDVGVSRVDIDVRVELFGRCCCYESLGFRDVGFTEEKLSIQIGEIDGVEIDLRGTT